MPASPMYSCEGRLLGPLRASRQSLSQARPLGRAVLVSSPAPSAALPVHHLRTARVAYPFATSHPTALVLAYHSLFILAGRTIVEGWARDTRSDELILLADGRAEDWRSVARAGVLLCPSPTCPAPELGVRACTTRRDHFFHRNLVDHCGGGGDEGAQHLLAKDTVRRWARDQGRDVDLERRVGGAIADVWIGPGRGVAFEIQYSQLTATDWLARDARCASAGVEVVWLLGHAGAMEPRIRGSRVRELTATQREIAGTPGRLLWIDPHRSELIAPDWTTGTVRRMSLASMSLPLRNAATEITRQVVGAHIMQAAPPDWHRKRSSPTRSLSPDPLESFRAAEPERFERWLQARERVRQAKTRQVGDRLHRTGNPATRLVR